MEKIHLFVVVDFYNPMILQNATYQVKKARQNLNFDLLIFALDDDKVWKQVATLPGLKYRSEGVLFNENTLWISGGAGDKKALKDSYLVSVDENGLGSVQLGPELPAEMDSHCVIKGDGIFFLIGGVGQSQKFFVYDQDDDEWRMGPDLNTQRVGHQCGF